MRVAQCGVYVREGTELCERSFVRESGERWGWLDVGEDREVAVYGSPAALRRLGAAVIAAATAAERLPDDPEPAAAALSAVARS